LVQGGVTTGAAGTGAVTFRATGTGSLAQGAIEVIGSGAVTLEAIGTGAFAGGICFAGTLRASGAGSVAYGYVTGTTGQLLSGGFGSFAHGAVDGTGSVINANGNGAFAGGYCPNGNMGATASGAFAHGLCAGGNFLSATAAGAFAVGDSTSGNILATAANSAQFGVGTNAVATSLQVGNAGTSTGVWLVGSGVPGAPVDGQIWKTVTTNIVSARSAGQTINLFRQAAYTQTFPTADKTHAARLSQLLTDSTGGTADTTCVAIAGTGDDANINNNFADIIAQITAIRADLADTAEVVNSIIDDLQVINLVA
jgi:hypothetical protein